MSPTSAEIQATKRRAVLLAEHVQLVQGHFAMENIPAREAENALQVHWCQNVPSDNGRGEARRVFVDDRKNFVSKAVPSTVVVPASIREVVWGVLNKQRDHVLSRGCDCRVEGRRHAHFNDGPRRHPARKRIGVRSMNFGESLRSQMRGAWVVGSRLVVDRRHRRKVGQLIHCHIYLCYWRLVVDSRDIPKKFMREMLCPDQIHISALRCCIREHCARTDPSAVLQCDACSAPALDDDMRNIRIGKQVRACLLCSRSNGGGHGSHAALSISPRPTHALELTHDMVKKDVSAARAVGARHRANNGVGRKGRE
eukprot:Opistho-2@77846